MSESEEQNMTLVNFDFDVGSRDGHKVESEELKEAREWWKQNLKYPCDLDEHELDALSYDSAKLLLAYHRYRLETDVRAQTVTFWLTNILLYLPEEKIIDLINQLAERVTRPKDY